MTSINGIDPIIVDTLKIPTQKPAIIETQKSKVVQDKKDKKKNSSKDSPELVRPSLLVAVDKLNRLLENHKIPLYFQIAGDNLNIKVQLISIDNQKIISELEPARVFELVTEFNTIGFTVDKLI